MVERAPLTLRSTLAPECNRIRNILGGNLDHTIVYDLVWKIEMSTLLIALEHENILLDVTINQ